MTLIVDALARIARECSVDEPSSWITATDSDQVALRDDFLSQAVDEILDRVDLPAPIAASQTITFDTDETALGYSLPGAFKRLQRDPLAVYETTPNRRACLPVSDDGKMTHIQQIGATGVNRFYQTAGYESNFGISFYADLVDGDRITVHYITDYWMATAAGTVGSAFTDATDVLILPRKVVEAGTIYRFRRRNGLPYDDIRAEFEFELSRLSNDSRVRRAIHFGEPEARYAPWDIPVPDYIPEA
jgi:hypothetical protein